MMLEPIIFPDVESLLIDALGDSLGVDVRSTVPADRELGDEFLRVVRVGGTSRDEVVDDATLVFEAWSDGRTGAMALAQRARGHVRALKGTTLDGVAIYRHRDVSAPAYQPDPDSQHPRAVFTAQVSARGEAETGS